MQPAMLHLYPQRVERSAGADEKSTFEKIVESLDGLPELKRVVFTGFGEPLTHPHILEMIAAIREHILMSPGYKWFTAQTSK